jgi:hypothetical protein
MTSTPQHSLHRDDVTEIIDPKKGAWYGFRDNIGGDVFTLALWIARLCDGE